MALGGGKSRLSNAFIQYFSVLLFGFCSFWFSNLIVFQHLTPVSYCIYVSGTSVSSNYHAIRVGLSLSIPAVRQSWDDISLHSFHEQIKIVIVSITLILPNLLFKIRIFHQMNSALCFDPRWRGHFVISWYYCSHRRFKTQINLKVSYITN